MLKRHLPLFLIVVMVPLLMLSCDKSDSEDTTAKGDEQKVEEKDKRVPVEIGTLETGPIEATVLSSANLEAEQQVKVYARTTNPVVALLVEEGDVVQKDQVLLRLEDVVQKISVEKAEARLEKARREHQRNEDLYNKELITLQAHTETLYELKQAELAWSEAKQDLDFTQVRAPISGTVTSRLVNLGDFVNTNQHIFDIVDFNSIVARIYLPEKNLTALALNQPARLTGQVTSDRVVQGYVKRIAPVVDAGTGTVKVTVGMNNIGPLRPGMYVDVTVVLNVNPNAILLPKRALVYDNDQIFAYKLNRGADKNTVTRLLVKPQMTDVNMVQPQEGFQTGDEIVTAGQTGLKNGAEVRIVGEESANGHEQNNPEEATTEVALD